MGLFTRLGIPDNRTQAQKDAEAVWRAEQYRAMQQKFERERIPTKY